MEPRLVDYLDSLVGTRYKTNGRNREDGIDCFGVFLDFYRGFLGRPLEDIKIQELPDHWFNMPEYRSYKQDLLNKHCSWRSEPELYCLVMMGVPGTPEINHMGVYLGEDKVLTTTMEHGTVLTKLSFFMKAKAVRGFLHVN